LTFLGPELASKRLDLLKQAVPNASRIAALWHPGAFSDGTTREMLQATEAAARVLGVVLQLLEVRAADDLDRAFSTAAMEGADAFLCSQVRCFSTSGNRLSISP
jgi:putative tryptophan/tyrosine transport system substrate-binding protein